jgi:hypothetical protein
VEEARRHSALVGEVVEKLGHWFQLLGWLVCFPYQFLPRKEDEVDPLCRKGSMRGVVRFLRQALLHRKSHHLCLNRRRTIRLLPV